MRYSFNSRVLFAGIVLGLSPVKAGPISDEAPLLSAVVEKILIRAPSLQTAHAHIREAASARREVAAAYWPKLELEGSFTRGDNPVYVFGSLLEQGRFGPENFAVSFLNNPPLLTNYRGGISAGVPLFTAFELSTQSRLTQLGMQQARSGSVRTSQLIRFEALAHCLRAQSAAAFAEVLRTRLESADREIADADELRRKGLVLGSDYYVAESIRAGLETWKLQTDGQRRQAEEALTILAGSPVSMSSAPLPLGLYKVEPLEALQTAALNTRADVDAGRLAAEGAKASEFQARMSLLPRAQAFGWIQTDTEDFSSSPSNKMVGVKMNVPLGDVGYGPRRSRLQAQRLAAEKNVAALEEAVRLDVTQARERMIAAQAMGETAVKARDHAAKALELFRPLYRSGRQSVMEVLRAEEGLARAESTVAQAALNQHLGWAQLQLATGNLDAATVRDLEERLKQGRTP